MMTDKELESTTLEMRWFFPVKPCAASALFVNLPQVEQRTDWYAPPGNDHCGVKLRDGSLEVKLLLDQPGPAGYAGVQGRLQRWRKWSAPLDKAEQPPPPSLLRANGWIAVAKARYQRLFALSESGDVQVAAAGVETACQLEWTELSVAGRRWWTMGLEAWGQPRQVVTDTLLAVVRQQLGTLRCDLALQPDNSFSYPMWLIKAVKSR